MNQSQYKTKRSGLLTASRLSCVIASPTTKKYRDYMDEIVESIQGVPQFEEDDKPWFRHGKLWESEAIDFYEWLMQKDVERFGGGNPKLFIHPKYDFIGCSPDFKEGNGGGEVKCHKSLNQFLSAEQKGLPTQHIPQVQGTIWILQSDWWNYISYFKNEKTKLIHIHQVKADLEYHKKLETACLSFWSEIQVKLTKG